MFTNLLASAPRRATGPGAWLASTAAHTLALAALLYLSGIADGPGGATFDRVTLVEITQPLDAPPPQPPPPPAPEPEPAAAEAAPVEVEVPKGYQTLAAPEEILARIPDPGVVAIRAEDFSGVGIAGGLARGTLLVRPDSTPPAPVVEAPVSVAVVDERPRVLNLNELVSRMRDLYPPNYRIAEVEAQVVVQLVVDREGRVEQDPTVVSTSHEAFAAPTLQVVRHLRWEPARRNGKPVRVWVRLPVAWSVDD